MEAIVTRTLRGIGVVPVVVEKRRGRFLPSGRWTGYGFSLERKEESP
jgi:hypothetical protein